jgi:hypothetical protein
VKKLLRYAMLWHRFLGVGICVFFGVWFASGIVMMYARMPELLESDRIDHLPPLRLDGVRVSPQEAVGGNTPLQRMTFGMLQGRPVYRILSQDSHWSVVYADDGTHRGKITPDTAVDIAAEFSGVSRQRLHWEKELTDVDQWTVYPASRPYLPFEVVAGDDSESTRYYVSAATGSVYLVTTRTGRFWAWCGAIPHWWYITALRANTPLWRIVMIVASGLGVVMALAGIITGVMRYSPSKRYRFRGGRQSAIPHKGMKRWHYILGYGFGLFTFTWIFSGLATMDPGNWSPGPDASLAERQAFAGGPIRTSLFQLDLPRAISILSDCEHLKEIELVQVNGIPYYLGTQAGKARSLVPAAGENNLCRSSIPSDQLLAASERLQGTGRIVQTTLLTRYDTYYYDRHDIKPLPILRVLLSDSHKTQLYINPQTGLIQARYTDRSRLERWLYNGLHSLDFPFLYHRRPLWDVTVIGLSLGGLVLSFTGIVLSIRYLRRPKKSLRRVLSSP